MSVAAWQGMECPKSISADMVVARLKTGSAPDGEQLATGVLRVMGSYGCRLQAGAKRWAGGKPDDRGWHDFTAKDWSESHGKFMDGALLGAMNAIRVMNVAAQNLKGVKCPKKFSAEPVHAALEVKDDEWFAAAVWRAMQYAAGCPNATSPAITFREGYAAWKAKDFQRARQLWDQACEGGNGGACEYLSVLLRAGQGGPQDLVRAREVLDKGCKSGNRAACAQLHDLDKQTKGQPQNKRESATPTPGTTGAFKEPEGWSGLKWDATEAEILKAHSATSCRTRTGQSAALYGERVCNQIVAVGRGTEVRADLNLRQGRLESVHFEFLPKDFDALRDEFIRRYGPPKAIWGVEPDRQVSWEGPNTQIYLWEGDDGEPLGSIETQAARAAYQRAKEAAKKGR
jgi:hypothetical protein